MDDDGLLVLGAQKFLGILCNPSRGMTPDAMGLFMVMHLHFFSKVKISCVRYRAADAVDLHYALKALLFLFGLRVVCSSRTAFFVRSSCGV